MSLDCSMTEEQTQRINSIDTLTIIGLTSPLNDKDRVFISYSAISRLGLESLGRCLKNIEYCMHQKPKEILKKEVIHLHKELERLEKIHQPEGLYLVTIIDWVQKVKRDLSCIRPEDYTQEAWATLLQIKKVLLKRLDDPECGLQVQYKKLDQFMIRVLNREPLLNQIDHHVQGLRSDIPWTDCVKFPSLFLHGNIVIAQEPEYSLEEVQNTLRSIQGFYREFEPLLLVIREYFFRAIVSYNEMLKTVEALQARLISLQNDRSEGSLFPLRSEQSAQHSNCR